MTCIAAVVGRRRVVMGGDSIAIAGHEVTLTTAPKVARVGPYLIGVAGNIRLGAVVHHAFKPPKPKDGVHFMATSFTDALRQSLDRAGVSRRQDGAEEHDSALLVAVKGRLYRLDADYQVLEQAEGYAVVGSGSPYALGSLHSTRGQKAKKRVRLALEAAAAHCASVRGPFVVRRSRRDER